MWKNNKIKTWMFLRSPSCCTRFDHVTNQFHLSLNFYFVLLFFYLLTRTILTTIQYTWYFFERLVCLPKNSTCLVLWETHLSYHCLANLYFQGKSYSKLKFSNMRTQYLYNHKLGNFSIIIVYETFNIFCLYFSIQNSSHFSMLGLGDIVSNIKMYIGKR